MNEKVTIKGKIVKDGRIYQLPENCRSISDIRTWLDSTFGKDSEIHISELTIRIEGIDKDIHFLETNDGGLASTTEFTEDEAKKIRAIYPFMEMIKKKE